MISGEYVLHPVGIVHSPVSTRREMPVQGVSGMVEVFPEYAAALEGIDRYSHLILLCWLHLADRGVLRASPRKLTSGLPEKGVFSIRSPVRPNPISVTVVRLTHVQDERFLHICHLDSIDGTPVIDIKPYQIGWDCVFSAYRGDRSDRILQMEPKAYQDSLVREAVNYHGECCRGVAVAVKMAERATQLLGGDLRRLSIHCTLGDDPCINDALVGITGARMGNRRLHCPPIHAATGGRRDVYVLSSPDTVLEFRSLPTTYGFKETLECDERLLFTVSRIKE